MIVIGGLNCFYVEENSEHYFVASNLHYEYNFDADVWKERETEDSCPPERAFHVCSVIDEAIIIYGGIGSKDKKLIVLNDCWKFESGCWLEIKTDLSLPCVFGTPSFVVDESIYVMCGLLHGKELIRISNEIEQVNQTCLFFYDTPDEHYNDVLFAKALFYKKVFILIPGKSCLDMKNVLHQMKPRHLIEFFVSK